MRYSVQPFIPERDADCFIQSVQEGDDFDGYIFLYRNGFNPASPLTNLIALDDDGPDFGSSASRGIDKRPLPFNDNYYLVTAGYNNAGYRDLLEHGRVRRASDPRGGRGRRFRNAATTTAGSPSCSAAVSGSRSPATTSP